MADRCQAVKWESPAGGGTQTDMVPTEINSNEDGLDARAVYLQNDSSEDSTTEVSRDASDNMTFKDGVVSGTKTLTDLLTGTIPEVIQYADESVDSTSDSAWVQAVRFSPTLAAKKYVIWYSMELFGSAVATAGLSRIQLDDTTTVVEGRTASTQGKPPHITVSGVYFFDNSGGSPGTFNFDFDIQAESLTISVQRKRLVIAEVTE